MTGREITNLPKGPPLGARLSDTAGARAKRGDILGLPNNRAERRQLEKAKRLMAQESVSRSSSKKTPFEVVTRLSNGSSKEEARFTCARCDAHASFPLVRGVVGRNPSATIKRAAESGWVASMTSMRAECPTCTKARKAAAAGDRPNKPTAEVTDMTKPTAPQPVIPVPLTNEQRLKVRSLLDKHFDDAAGRYLDGYSDQRVAAEVGAPRIHVERAREAAYGPIKAYPEVDAAQKALNDCEVRIRVTLDMIDAHRRELEAALKMVDSARALLRAA